ncbi:hypothetical protein CYMTET_22715 [Cymbomonas tetramitiformis]|uniref:Uncharacterized protein n=1 Tax=Cymbomonas tetramitiformis TaxID=36881 RepID=A0AAE0FZV5_9CHLO|nr:hypothetical protein CYMTET_22715 [Cymbomonas tetramitiformis]
MDPYGHALRQHVVHGPTLDRPRADPGPTPDRPWTKHDRSDPGWTSTDQTSDRRPTVRTIYGPRVDPAWTPHGPMGGALEMDCTGEAMRGPRMDLAWTREWRTQDGGGAPEIDCAKKAMCGPRMDPWGGAPGMGCVVKAMRGPRMDPAWTSGWSTRGGLHGEGDAWMDLAWTRGVAHPR